MKGIGSDVAARKIIYLCKAKHINTTLSICFDTEAQIINGNIFLQNMNEPFTGNNLCEYISGQVKSKGNIKDGKLDGKLTNWYENGQIWSEEYYKDGKKDGKLTNWHKNGLKKREGNYKDGRKDGKWTDWYENGQRGLERDYKNGKKDGKWTYWYKNDQKIWLDGQIWSEEHYKDGKQDT